jgi:hypothetical protein
VCALLFEFTLALQKQSDYPFTMKRRLISSYGIVEKIFPFFFALMSGFLLVVVIFSQTWNTYIFLIALVLFTVLAYLSWKAFNSVHPLYFDENAFYWKERTGEQRVDFSNVLGLTTNSMPGRGGGRALISLTLEFTLEDDLKRSIMFFPVSVFVYNPFWVLIQCEKAIQVKKPGFKIESDVVSFEIERETDAARTYKIR